MANIELKYNPYTKKVEKCASNGKPFDLQSAWGTQDKELGEWVASFIEKMDAHFNEGTYTIDFEGIERDFNFLEDAAKEYKDKHSDVKITVNSKSNITPAQKFDELKDLFAKMQNESPFAELKTPELTALFNKAMSSEFELAVVATMSSGKSTLINAMLGCDLLPARNDATTANLTRIHDRDGVIGFSAEVKNSEGDIIERIDDLKPGDMDKLNERGNIKNESSNDFVSVVDVYGDIEGVDSTNMQLVLTDSPGTNNSQNTKHKEHTLQLLKNEFKPMILYVFNPQTYQSDDVQRLLKDEIAPLMNNGNRQSHDRFVFVLNKVDEIIESNEDLGNYIEKVKSYIERECNIKNAKVFPCDALSAKTCRQFLNGDTLTENQLDIIDNWKDKYIKRDSRKYSKYSPLSPRNLELQNQMLREAEADESDNGSIKQALVYTGIPAIELAVNEYLSKYALPAKLTKGVDSFKQKIVNLGLEAHANKALSENKDAIEKTKVALNKVEELVSSGQMGKKMAEGLKDLNLDEQIKQKFNDVRKSFMKTFSEKTDRMRKNGIDKSLAEEYASQINDILKDMQVSFKTDIDSAIQKGIGNLAKEQVEKLNNVVKELVGESDFSLSSAEGLLGDAATISVEETLSSYEYDEDVKVGEHWEKNEDKKWYKPWTWLQEKGWMVDDYETVQKVDFSNFMDSNVEPEVSKFLDDARNLTENYAKEEQKRLQSFFEKQISEIEKKIKEKAGEKQALLSDQEKFNELMEQNQKNLEWLNQFNAELDNILVI